MRPTDADALMPLFIEKANKMKDRHGVKLGEEWLLNYDDIKDVIDNAPTVERPQGEWIEEKLSCGNILRCSECGTRPRRSEYGYDLRDNFCHNCGADMRGGRE